MRDKTYDLFVSLGSVCSCSSSLRKSYLQFWSYPFDWIAQGNIIQRCSCIVNNFEGWLEKNNLEFIGTREEPEPRSIYKDKVYKFVYNHDFKINAPIEESYDEVAEKYKRRINRLMEQISQSKKVCFVYVDTPDQKTPISNEILIQVHDMLQKRFLDVSVHLLYLFVSKEHEFKDRVTTKITDKITKVEYDFDMYDETNIQLVDIKAVAELFKLYSITDRFVTSKNRYKKFMYKIKIKAEKIFHLTTAFYKGKKYRQITLFGFTKRLGIISNK